jgi:hypothetical protein
VCIWLWASLCGINAAFADSVKLQPQVPKVDSSQATSAQAPRTLRAEIHESWLFRELGFECSSTAPRTITKVFPGTQASLKGLQPGDQLIDVQQHGATAFVDVRRGKNRYRATISSEPKPQPASQKPIVEHPSEKNKNDNELFLIADCSVYTISSSNVEYKNSEITPLEWCKQQMKLLDSTSADGFPVDLTFITYTGGGYSKYEHCSIEQVKQLWLEQSGSQCPQKSGDPLQDIINTYVDKHSPEERHRHKLIVAIVSTQVGSFYMPAPSQRASSIAASHANDATTHKLDPSDVSITVLRLGNDPRATLLNTDSFVFPEKSITYLPFSRISDDDLLPTLSRVFQAE